MASGAPRPAALEKAGIAAGDAVRTHPAAPDTTSTPRCAQDQAQNGAAAAHGRPNGVRAGCMRSSSATGDLACVETTQWPT